MDLKSLIHKYSMSGPRYTSYPTAPQWTADVTHDQYESHLGGDQVQDRRNMGLYIHLPFCESLCYFCGCNIQITSDKSRSHPYVNAVTKELSLVSAKLKSRCQLSQIHWGGGTPTFLSLDEIQRLYEVIQQEFDIDPDADISIEVDPRVTSEEQLALLADLGFNRISLGVQDFAHKVQKAINRIQPEEMTRKMLEQCRKLGFKGINFDLIYGLPFQSLSSFEKTIDSVIAMRPSRIALYNYARLPEMLKHQVILEKFPMPEAEERVDIFLMAYEKLSAAGYGAIGMDHFATRDDELFSAIDRGELYRNFMGYVAKKSGDLLGVGVSAIGEVGGGFFQNEKKVQAYEQKIGRGELTTVRGKFLSDDDKQRKWLIQKIMCQFEIPFAGFKKKFGISFEEKFADVLAELPEFESDGILKSVATGYEVTELGRMFVRNVAMKFDAYLQKSPVTYSKTV